MRSVFTKLSVVILVAVISIHLLVFGLFGAERRSSRAAFQAVLSRNLDYLIKDLGTPPRLDQARQLVGEGLIYIRYETNDTAWSTDDAFVPSHEMGWHQWKMYPYIRSAMWQARFLVAVEHENGTYLFAFGRNFDQESERTRFLVVLLLILTTLFVVIYFSIRWILKPVKWLKQGVHEISRGNLNHRVPVKRADELKDLADAFNAMTERIREMLHAKERLLLDVSHELRSPLTRMRVASEFLPESHARVSIQTDIQEMDTMISDVLDTAKHHHRHARLNPQNIDLSEIISTLVPFYENLEPGMHFNRPDEPVHCNVDVDRIKTVFQNIMDNAVKYSGGAGRPVEIAIKQDRQQIYVRIRDYGIGIPDEEIPYLLEPFYRVDKSRSKQTGGYGLGLSICSTIMEAHGGKIEIDSTPGKGTKVTLIFPK